MNKAVDDLAMLSEEEARALDLLGELLVDRFGSQVSDIILFGSTARGEATTQSDIDVLVFLRDPDALDLRAAGGLSFDVWLETGVFLSTQIVAVEDWRSAAELQTLFFRNVSRDGISLRKVA